METKKEIKSKKSIISLILGIIGLISWALPVIGAPVTIIGLILGIKGRKTNRKKLATAGIILCIIGLFATVVNGAIGSYKGSTGTLFNQSTSQNTGKITFCENVDNSLNPTNTKDTFNVNNQFYARFDNNNAFKTSKLKFTIYTIDGNSQSLFYKDEQDVDQDNTVLAIPVNIDTAGKYKITITRSSDDKKLGEGTVTIQ